MAAAFGRMQRRRSSQDPCVKAGSNSSGCEQLVACQATPPGTASSTRVTAYLTVGPEFSRRYELRLQDTANGTPSALAARAMPITSGMLFWVAAQTRSTLPFTVSIWTEW